MSKKSGDAGSRKEKLEMVIKRSYLIIDMLDKKGMDIRSQKDRMNDAKVKFGDGRIEESYRIAMECIGELKEMKARPEVTEGQEEKEKKKGRGKGVFALIRDNTAQMEKKIEEWKFIIKGWRNKGYQFEPDDSLFKRSFDEIEKRFISIGEQIEKAERIRGSISKLRDDYGHVGKSYLVKIDEIEKAVFRLDRLDDIERRLKALTGSITSVESRYRDLRNRIGRFKRKELKTSSLEEMMENDEDLDYLEKQFKIYESNIDFLHKEKMKLKKLKENPFADQYKKQADDLEKMIDDPWMLDHVVEGMLELERAISKSRESDERLKEENKRREDIKKSLEKYRAEGIKVDMVEQLLDEDMNLLEEEFDIFIKHTAKLRSLKEKLFKLDAAGFEDEISTISEKLFDPGNIDEVEGEMNKLKDRILNHKIRSQKIKNHIKEWSGMGFKVSKLENALSSNMELAENIHDEYESRIAELMDFESRLKDIDQRELQDLVHKVNLKIKDPELIEPVRKEMKDILERVKDLDTVREKRKELNILLKTWRSQGYNIDKILEDTNKVKTMEGLEKVILDKTRAIAALESFKNEFSTYERGWFPDLEDKIKQNMDNPDKFKETLKDFSRLKDIIKKEEKRRGEISRKLTELSNRGIEISRINSLLTEDTDTLNREYKTFKEKIRRLLMLKKDLLQKAQKTGDQEMDMFAKSLNDPYKIEQYEDQLNNRETGRKEVKENNVDREKVNEMKKEAKELFKQDKLAPSLELFEKVLKIVPDDKESIFYDKKIKVKIKTRGPDGESAGTEGGGGEDTDDKGIGDPNCLSCKGSGKCVWCEGTGKCSTCNGSGKSFGDPCPTCKGSGKCSVCKGKGNCSWCNP